MTVIVGVIAMAVLLVFTGFRSIGFASKEERDPKTVGIAFKRFHVAYRSTLWGGPVLLLLGQSIGWYWMFQLGIIIWILTVPLFISAAISLVRYRKRHRERVYGRGDSG